MSNYTPEFSLPIQGEITAQRLKFPQQQEQPPIDTDLVDWINIQLTEIQIRSINVLGTSEQQADWATLILLASNARRLEFEYRQQTVHTDYSEFVQAVLGDGVNVVLSNGQPASVFTASDQLQAMLQTYASDPNFEFLQLATDMMLGKAHKDAPGNIHDFLIAQTFFAQLLDEQIDSGASYDEALAALCADLELSVEFGESTIHFLHKYLEHIQTTNDTTAAVIAHEMVEQGALADLFPSDYNLEIFGSLLLPQEAYEQLVEQYIAVTVANPRYESVAAVPSGMVEIKGFDLMPEAQAVQEDAQVVTKIEELLAGTSNGTYLEGTVVPFMVFAALLLILGISRARHKLL